MSRDRRRSRREFGVRGVPDATMELTLLAFGEHYRSVIATPEGTDHGNIRALIANGLAGVKFSAQPLTRKA